MVGNWSVREIKLVLMCRLYIVIKDEKKSKGGVVILWDRVYNEGEVKN